MLLPYLCQAQRAGAQVHPQLDVSWIERNRPTRPAGPNAYTIHYDDVRWGFSGAVFANKLIISAGVVGANQLLLRAQRGFCQRRGKIPPPLPGFSPMLGEYFSGNGGVRGGTFKGDRTIEFMG